jgi:hypothetical protein
MSKSMSHPKMAAPGEALSIQDVADSDDTTELLVSEVA